MPAALAALHDDGVGTPRRDLLGVATGADDRHDRDAGVLQQLHVGFAGRERERRDPHPFVDEQPDTRVGVLGVGAQVHAERTVGARL